MSIIMAMVTVLWFLINPGLPLQWWVTFLALVVIDLIILLTKQ